MSLFFFNRLKRAVFHKIVCKQVAAEMANSVAILLLSHSDIGLPKLST